MIPKYRNVFDKESMATVVSRFALGTELGWALALVTSALSCKQCTLYLKTERKWSISVAKKVNFSFYINFEFYKILPYILRYYTKWMYKYSSFINVEEI